MSSTTARGKVEQPVWVGEVEAVQELALQMKSLVDYVKDKRVTTANDNWRERCEYFKEHVPAFVTGADLEEAWKRHDAEFYQAIANTALRMVVAYRRWERTSSGTPEEIFAEGIDVADVVSIDIEMEGSSYPRRDGYALAASLSPSGASAAFKAPEPGFIDMAGTRLKDQFKRQRPRYWWFRATWAPWVVSAPTFLALLVLTVILVLQGYNILTVLLFQLIFAAIVIPIGVALLRKIATPFELLKPNSKARGAKKISAAVGLAVWVLSTVAIPLWLGALATPSGQ